MGDSLCYYLNYEHPTLGFVPTKTCESRLTTLPEAAIINILLRLPAETLFKLISASKTVRGLVYKPEFAIPHLNSVVRPEIMLRPCGQGSLSRSLYLVDLGRNRPYAQFTLPLSDELCGSGIDVVNSCDGMLCLCRFSDKNPVVICNPITKEYINLPRTRKESPAVRMCVTGACECPLSRGYERFASQEKVVASGFGYGAKANRYMVIRLLDDGGRTGFGSADSSGRIIAQICTVGHESWRKIPFPFRMIHTLNFATFVDGKLFWACAIENKLLTILAFHFNNEQFEFVELPAFLLCGPKDIHGIKMLEFGGYLAICDYDYRGDLVIWVRRKSRCLLRWMLWGKLTPKGRTEFYEPIVLVSENHMVMAVRDKKALVSFTLSDITMKRSIAHSIHGILCNFEARGHIPCFRSLKDIVGGNSVEVLTIKTEDTTENFSFHPQY